LMRVIGLIGGVSWHSTVDYYRYINEAVAERLGDAHSAKLVLYSLDLGEIRELHAQGRERDVERILVSAARALEAAGAGLGLICANTLHRYYDAVTAAVDMPFIHIADATAEAARAAGVSRVGLLGTRMTMEEPFYRERLAGHGIEVLVPPPEERAELDRIIFEELVRGRFTEEARRRVAGIAERLVERGAEGIVLGCTELPILLRGVDLGVPVFDTTRLHALKAVEEAFSGVDGR